MAFLQVKNNLGDLNNICEAQKTLGLMSMAYQCKNNVDIQGGKIAVSNLRLKHSGELTSNYVLVSKNSNGDVMWKRQALQEWMEQSPAEIPLSSFCNDQNYIKETEINVTISNYIEEFRDTIINNNLVVESISISNIHVNGSFDIVPDDASILNQPCILTNQGAGSNLRLTLIDQSFSNNDSTTVCSSMAVSNLYDIVKDVQASLPSDVGSTYMISTNNLNEVGFNPQVAVQNLGLNDSFHTRDFTVSNMYFNTPHVIPEINYNKKYYLYRHQDTLNYKEIININTYDNENNANTINAASSRSVYDLYSYLNGAVNDRLVTSNVLSEFFEPLEDGSVNPQIDMFKERLTQVGIQEVAFTSNWYHLGNAPRKLSAFSNTDFNDETLFIYGKCNLSDIFDPTQAMINLGVSKVGRTGNFADLLLPTAISNIITADDVLGAIPGIPFLVKTEFLSELSNNSAYARSNLGIHDMATFSQYNVEILNGNVTACNVVINSNLRYLHSNTSIEYAGIEGNNTFLKCFTSDGLGKWDTLPVAETALSTQGIVYLTNDLTNSSSNVAVTAYALSNVFYNNDRITDLVPLASTSSYGIVKTTDAYASPPELSENVVVNAEGISNMYYVLKSNVDSSLKEVTVSNNSLHDFLQITNTTSGNDRSMKISLNFPNTNNEYLAADGRFKVVQPTTLYHHNTITTLSNNIEFQGDSEIMEFDGVNNRVIFKNTIYHNSNGISIDSATRKISNTGIVTANPVYFYTTQTITGNEITPKGGLIGTTADRIVGSTNNTFLQFNAGIYSFQPLNLNDFNRTSRGFVPTPPDPTTSYVLLNAGWTLTSDYFQGNQTVFDGTNNGVVREYLDSGNKADKFLNAEGAWIDKVDIMDLTGAVTSIDINSENNNVLGVSGTSGDVTIGFDNALQNQVVTKNSHNEYVWMHPFELIKNEAAVVAGVSDENMYLNAAGNFVIPPGAMNFSALMNIDANNVLTITQPLGADLPITATFTCNVTLDFVHKYNNVLYENNGDYVVYDRSGTTVNAMYSGFVNVNNHLIEKPSYSNRTFTISGTRHYIDMYVNDFTIDSISPTPPPFVNNKFFSTKATSNYVSDRIDFFRSTQASGPDFRNDWKLVTPLAVSNYVNDHYVKLTERIDDTNYNITDVSRSTPTDVLSFGALSNLLFKEMIQMSYATANNFGTNKVFSSATLSNYVKTNYINVNEKFNYNASFEDNFDKVVRASNVLKILEDNRFTKQDTDFKDDKSFVTPFALSNYADLNYIKLNEKTIYSDIVNNYKDKVIIGGTLSNYVNEQVTFDYNSSFTGNNYNKIVRASNVLKILEDNRYDKLKNVNFLNDNQFTTPLAVSNYVNANYLKVSNRHDYTFPQNTLALMNTFDPNHILSIGALSNLLLNNVIQKDDTLSFANNTVLSSYTMSNYIKDNYVNVDKLEKTTEFLGYYDDTYIPTTATTSNIVNHILDGDRFSDKTTLSTLTNDPSLLVNEDGLKSILDNVVMGYEKHNHLDWTNDGTYKEYSAFTTNFTGSEDDLVNKIIPTVDLVKDLIDAKIANVTKNTKDLDGTNGWYSWSDQTSLSNNMFLPTIGLMEYTIENKLAGGVSLNLAELVVDSFTINQQLTFYPANYDRTEIENGKMFLTIDSEGHHMFKQVDTLSGFNAEVTEGDEYSMVTGSYTKTFGDNQLVCGTYNSSNNIYKQIGLSEGITLAGKDTPVNFVVGTGSADTHSARANGLEVHDTGEVYVRSNLILGNMWRLSFDNETLSIEKREGNTYIQKHIFK